MAGAAIARELAEIVGSGNVKTGAAELASYFAARSRRPAWYW